jgi:hypothetical protein
MAPSGRPGRNGIGDVPMIGLMFIAAVIGLWLLAAALTERDFFFGVADVTSLDLVLGDGIGRMLCAGFGAALVLIGVLGTF